MARECAICAKKKIPARKYLKLRGKYNPTPKYHQEPNLQYVKVDPGTKRSAYKKFVGKRVLMCSRCRRTLVKTKTKA